ncbi:acyltransferase [Burkholderia sp. Bp8963]|uniref:acyltransferase family protein n=1 Tax=Burkholderia sp. Bp8963 TaxID=2184547 RepID=UPI00163A0D5F|nr:acyltransferase [Burkholderia sp. Bp8963]
MNTENTTRRNATLDLIRSLAAAEVAIGHMRNLVMFDFVSGGFAAKAFYLLTAFGKQAVIVFFVLSGYLVGGSVVRDVRRNSWSWQKYLLDRFTRLWIVLIPALLLTLFWDHIGISIANGSFYRGTEGNWVTRVDISENLGFNQLICNAAFLQTLACNTFGSNGPLWSLANEFWYYMWFPVFYVAASKARTPRGIALIVPAIVAMVAFAGLLEGFSYWLLGVVAYEIRLRVSIKNGTPYIMVATAALVISLVIGKTSSYGHAITAAGFFLLLVAITTSGAQIISPTISKIASGFSDMSYTLYLTHLPLTMFLVAVLFGERVPLGTTGLIRLAAIAIGCFAYSYAVYYLFERNTTSLRAILARGVSINSKKAG